MKGKNLAKHPRSAGSGGSIRGWGDLSRANGRRVSLSVTERGGSRKEERGSGPKEAQTIGVGRKNKKPKRGGKEKLVSVTEKIRNWQKQDGSKVNKAGRHQTKQGGKPLTIAGEGGGRYRKPKRGKKGRKQT